MIRRRRCALPPGLLVLTLLSSLAWPTRGSAQDIEDMGLDELLDRDLDEQLGTTTAVSRKKESVLSAPATLTTLTWERIRLSGARTVPDLLRWVPGVQVYRNTPGNYIVALRGTAGLNGNNVVVTLNGVPINSPLDASIDWDLIPLHIGDIDRIEVVRGPVSTIYGQNAYTGVINIVTRSAYGPTTSVAARGEIGADTEGGLVGALSGRYAANGERSRLGVFALGETDATGHNDSGDTPALHRAGAMTHLEFSLTEHSVLKLDLSVTASQRSSLDHLVQESNPQTRMLGLGAIRYGLFQLGSFVESIEFWIRDTIQLSDTEAERYSGFSYAETSTNRGAAGVDINVHLLSDLSLTLGSEIDLEWVDAPYVNETANDRIYSGYGVYATLGYLLLERVRLNAGARVDRPTATGELKLSYRAGAVYEADEWSVRLGASSAYRTPSYVELGGRFVDPASGLILLEGNPDLESPTNQTLEVGLIAGLSSGLHISPTLYVSRLTDTIVEDFEPLVRRTFVNDPNSRDLLGAEFELNWALRDDLSLDFSAGWLHWLDVDDDVTPTIGVPEQNSTFTLGASVHGNLMHERFGYGIGATFVGDREFAVRAGVPPRILDADTAAQAQLFAMAEYSLGRSLPLWLSLRVFTGLPFDKPESPLPAAASGSSTAIFGVTYRDE